MTITADTFTKIASLDPDEVVTNSYVRDIPISDGRILALLTLDNGKDHTRPNTLGPKTLVEFARVLDEQTARAAAGEIHGLAVIGKPFIFAAGADLSKVGELPDRETGKQMAQLGHWSLGKLSELGVPSFTFFSTTATTNWSFNEKGSDTSPSFASKAHLIICLASCKPPN